MSNKQTAVEWLATQIMDNWNDITAGSRNIADFIEQAKEMEDEQKNNLPIHIHEGIKNTWVYIEDGIVHVKPNTEKPTNDPYLISK